MWDASVSDEELADARADALSRMTSTCTIRRFTGRSTGEDGFDVDTYATIITDSPCRVAGPSRGGATARREAVGQVEVEAALRVLHLPAETTGIADGDLVDVTSGETAGLALKIVEATWADQQTARRFAVVEIQRPPEWA